MQSSSASVRNAGIPNFTSNSLPTNIGNKPSLDINSQNNDIQNIQKNIDNSINESQKTLNKEIRSAESKSLSPIRVNKEIPTNYNLDAQMPAVPSMQDYVIENVDSEIAPVLEGKMSKLVSADITNLQSQAQKEHQKHSTQTQEIGSQLSQEITKANRETQKSQREQTQRLSGEYQRQKKVMMQKHQEEVRSFQGEFSKEKGALSSEVTSKLKSAETEVQSRYTQVENTAQRKHSSLVKAGNKAKADQSWWDETVDFVASSIKGVISLVADLFEAAWGEITDLFQKTVNWANSVFESAKNWITEKIDSFTSWAQERIDALLNLEFSDLVDTINKAIDWTANRIKQAATNLVEALEETVKSTIDKAKSMVDATIRVFEEGVKVITALGTAIVTGNFDVFFDQLIQSICDLSGISRADFDSLMGSVQSTIQVIIDDPGKFISNLIEANKGGFEQFGDKFPTHLQNGFESWIADKFGDLEAPKDWSPKGLFEFTANFFGWDRDYVISKVARLIGGEEDQKTVEKVIKEIDELIQNGWGGLFDRFVKKIDNIEKTAIDAVISWVQERVIQKAVLRLATMFSPVGAIVRVIQLAFNMVNFLTDNFSKLMGVAKGITENIQAIALGNLGPAKNKIESTLASLIPVAIDLFAKLVNLGKITGAVEDAIDQIKETVDEKIDESIDKIRDYVGLSRRDRRKADKEAEEESGDGKKKKKKRPSLSIFRKRKDVEDVHAKRLTSIAPKIKSKKAIERIDDAFKKKGKPLPKKWKNLFEEKFGTNFDSVRIVTGKVANRACKAADAVALTHKKKIVLSAKLFSNLKSSQLLGPALS